MDSSIESVGQRKPHLWYGITQMNASSSCKQRSHLNGLLDLFVALPTLFHLSLVQERPEWVSLSDEIREAT